MLTSQAEDEEYEANIRQILKDLVFHTMKNKPENVVSYFHKYFN